MRSLAVSIVDSGPTAEAVATALRRRGHAVAEARSAEEALTLPSPEVLVAEVELPDLSGFDLLACLREDGIEPRAVFVTARPSWDDCRRALRMRAAEFLAKPFRLEDLVRAVEGQGQDPLPDYERTYAATPETVERATRDLAAYALRAGIGPSIRARIASAAAEVFDNACRHAHPESAPPSRRRYRVRASLGRREITVSVEDGGLGFDAAEVASHAFESPLHNGLARAACLAEDIELESLPGAGARVTLRFSAYQVEFDDDGAIDLTEHEHLNPELARQILRSLIEGKGRDPYRLSPALAVVVGRLLAGPGPRRAAELALWS